MVVCTPSLFFVFPPFKRKLHFSKHPFFVGPFFPSLKTTKVTPLTVAARGTHIDRVLSPEDLTTHVQRILEEVAGAAEKSLGAVVSKRQQNQTLTLDIRNEILIGSGSGILISWLITRRIPI